MSVITVSNLASMVYHRDARKEISDAFTTFDAIEKGIMLGLFFPHTFYRLGKQCHMAYRFGKMSFMYPFFVLDFSDLYPAESFLLNLLRKIETREITSDEADAILDYLLKKNIPNAATENGNAPIAAQLTN